MRFFLISVFVIAASAGYGQAGGGLTIEKRDQSSFGHIAPDAWASLKNRFFAGRRLFHSRWHLPKSGEVLEGLGPLFNAHSCGACHLRDGRGRPHGEQAISKGGRDLFEAHFSLVILLRTPDDHGRYIDPEPMYGFQFQPHGHGQYENQKFPGEGRVYISYEEEIFKYPDGTQKSLRRPTYHLRELSYGGLADHTLIMPRLAPAVFGLGLLEAISEEDILKQADPNDADGDGVSGEASITWNYLLHQSSVGRFGWTASQPTLRQQNASAAVNDMSLMNRIFPFETITIQQSNGRDIPTSATLENPYELIDQDLSLLTLYVHLLAVPDARPSIAADRGQELFSEFGCTDCHRPHWQTDLFYEGLELLAGQKISPYTDLLLHDMGDGLADLNIDGEPERREWRTPPLWGMGLHQVVNGNGFFLHDGRARDLEEAILWHGGEAKQSLERFAAADLESRKALMSFLESL